MTPRTGTRVSSPSNPPPRFTDIARMRSGQPALALPLQNPSTRTAFFFGGNQGMTTESKQLRSLLKFPAGIAVLLALTTTTTGCEVKSPDDSAGNLEDQAELVIAEEWSDVSLISWGAKVDLDVTGHFTVSRNACFMADGGAISDKKDWNTIAGVANLVAKTEPNPSGTEDTCIENPRPRWGFDGNGELKLERGGKKPLMDAIGGKICSSVIKDPAVLDTFVKAINRMLAKAAREGCPEAPRD